MGFLGFPLWRRELALAGAHVIFAVRNTNGAKDLISQWQATQPEGTPPLHCEVQFQCLRFQSLAQTSNARHQTIMFTDMLSSWLQVMELDCLSFDSVRKLAEAWEARKLPLHLLINNAGIFCMTGAHLPSFPCTFNIYMILFVGHRFCRINSWVLH